MDLGAGKLNDLLIWPSSYIIYAIEKDEKSIQIGEKKYLKFNKIYKLPKVYYIHMNVLSNKILSHPLLKGIKVDHIICNFAFHYFMKNNETFKHIIKLIKLYLKKKGSVRITTLNGTIIENILKNRKKYSIYNNKYNILTIIKKWNKIMDFGQEINVFIISIGKWHNEYLVKDNVIITNFEKNGFNLKKIKMFNEFQTIIIKDLYNKKIKNFKLTNNEKIFSFLHMYIEFYYSDL